jgi:hypothetical protein
MKNPWVNLPARPPFVLADDAPFIAVFNRTASKGVVIGTHLMPAPFLGSPRAPVVILALNPGWSPGDEAANRDPAFRRLMRDNLRQKPVARPFVPLNGDPNRPGARWWRRNAKVLIAEAGEERVARGLCCLEYFPYHSRSFGHAALRLPSQHYTFALLRQAMARRAVIVITRGARYWTGAVPELANYRRLVRTSNPRSASISPTNCGVGFKTVLRALQRTAN